MDGRGPELDVGVVYVMDGVYVHPPEGSVAEYGNGTLKLIQAPYGEVIEWLPAAEEGCQPEREAITNELGWDLVDTVVGYRVAGGTVDLDPNRLRLSRPIMCELVDLKSYKLSSPSQGWPHITFMQKDGSTHPTLHFHNGGLGELIAQLKKYVCIKESSKEPGLFLVTDPKVEALQRSLNELQLFTDRPEDAVSKFFHNPYVATLSGFSKVTNMVRDYVVHGASPGHSGRPPYSFSDGFATFDLGNHDDLEFEVINCKELGIRPKVTRGPPLTAEKWINHFDKDGRLQRVDELKETVFRGGVVHSIRNEVWKFLLGYYDYESSYDSRQIEKKSKTDFYYKMKLQWKSMSPVQEKRFSDFRDRKSLVDKDVSRTDRTDAFFAGENNENVQLLNDILMTYCMYNFDLGYVQGMSDLLSPILVIMQNEVDAFWCFANFMERMAINFEMDQEGIKMQLRQLHILLCCLDPELGAYFESHDSGNMYFCFRWLLIIFKREFSFADVMRLWEVLWTNLPCKNFHLLFCLAILDTEKHTVIESKFGFTEILKHMNDLAHHIALEDMLCKAEAIFVQISESRETPANVREILGLPLLPAISPTAASSDQQDQVTSSVEDLERRYQDALNLQYM